MLCLPFENRAFRNQAGREKAPQRHHQLARQGDDGNAFDAFAGVGRAFAVPTGECAVGLVDEPQPGQFDGGVAGTAIAGLADPLLAIGLTSPIGSNCIYKPELTGCTPIAPWYLKPP
jgi:hypothetical protein